MCFLKCTLYNISTGEACLPMAFIATVIVTFVPLTTDVTLTTCLIALVQIICGGTRTVELPVSS
jgi:hypothetical protein